MPDTSGPDVPWLVLRAQAGDRTALEDLLRHAQQVLRPYVKAMVRDDDDASDVMQHTLIVLYRKLHTLREPRVFTAWARRVASREVFRWARRRRGREEFVDELPDMAAEDTSSSPASELREQIPGLLHRISPASRAVIALHYLEGLSIDETAAVLDISTGTAKSRLAYGLSALRRIVPEATVRV